MVIVDTTAWIDYLRGTDSPEAVWLDRELTRQRLGLTDLILCEVLQGIRDQADFVKLRDHLLKFHLFPNGGKEVAIKAALKLPQSARPGLHHKKNHRLSDCHFLFRGRAHLAAPRPLFRCLREGVGDESSSRVIGCPLARPDSQGRLSPRDFADD